MIIIHTYDILYTYHYRNDIEMKECQVYGHVEISPRTQEGQQDETDVYETI